MAAASPLFLFLSLLILFPSPSHSVPFSSYHTLFSLSHSLISRVSTLRAARGDLEGAARARNLANTLERGLGLGFYRFAWNVGWDYLRNYAWRDTMSFGTLGSLLSDLNELFGAVNELSRIRSDSERVTWIGRNYQRILRVSKSVVTRLLRVFRESGPLHDVVMALQKEVIDGDLLRDCLELGADDLKGLIQILKDLALQYSNAPSPNTEL